MTSKSPDYEALLSQFLTCTKDDLMKYATQQHGLTLPILSADVVMQLCEKARGIFENESVMLNIKSPVTIVGDLHGHILDLFRIIQQYGLPDKTRYLFLGDIVDRGEFSVETIEVVFMMKILWPEDVFIIRGNHEFEFLCLQCGFSHQVSELYSNGEVFQSFLKTFSYMPIGALIDEQILCVHGGIGPSVFSTRQICQIQRPLLDFGDDIIDSLLWSDPSNETETFEPSSRGSGYFFGKESLLEFNNLSRLKLFVRAHECVMGGYEFRFENQLLTVFSASNYCGLVGNESSVCNVLNDHEWKCQTFPPFPYLRRTPCSSRRKAQCDIDPKTRIVMPILRDAHKPNSVRVESNPNQLGLTPPSSSFRRIPKLVSASSERLPSLVPEKSSETPITVSSPVFPRGDTRRRRSTVY